MSFLSSGGIAPALRGGAMSLMAMALFLFGAESVARASCFPGIHSGGPHSGDPVLQRPQIQLVFWGTGWPNGYAVHTGQIVGAVQDMINGPFFSGLAQYQTPDTPAAIPGMPRLVPNVVVKNDSDPPQSFCTDGLRGSTSCNRPGINETLQSLFGTQLSTPTSGVNMLYVVFLPPGIHSANRNDDLCVGGNVSGCNPHSTYNGARYNYAWLINADFPLNHVDSITQVFAHEVAEAISDPGAKWGISGGLNQVADACGGCNQVVNGNWYSVAAYYSVRDGRCIAPRAWSGVMEFPDDPSATNISGPVRQVYGMGYTLLVTDNAQPANVYLKNSSDVWAKIGVPTGVGFGSTYAITAQNIYAVTPDQTQILQRTSGRTWSTIKTNTDGSIHSIFGGGNDNLIAIASAFGLSNQVLQYAPSVVGWSVIDRTPRSQFVAYNPGFAAVSLNHDKVYLYDSAKHWNQIDAGPIESIYAGDDTLLETSYNTKRLYKWQGTTDGWAFTGQLSGYSQSIASSFETYIIPNPNPVPEPLLDGFLSTSWSTLSMPAGGIHRMVGAIYGLADACPPPAQKPSAQTDTCP